ncbi:MAG: PaaI family thioesterase [Planctomycetaceae bacterium]
MGAHRIPEAIAADLAERLRDRFRAWPLVAHWGVTLAELHPGRAELHLPAGALVTNGPRGQVNGGVLAALADLASALALSTAFDGRMPFATSDLHIRYLEPAVETVAARGEVVRLSGRGAVVECRILSRGELACLATAHFAIRRGLDG